MNPTREQFVAIVKRNKDLFLEVAALLARVDALRDTSIEVAERALRIGYLMAVLEAMRRYNRKEISESQMLEEIGEAKVAIYYQ